MPGLSALATRPSRRRQLHGGDRSQGIKRRRAALRRWSHLERRCGFESDTSLIWESLLSTKPSIRPSIGTEDPIPEEMDHREIAVRVPVMNEVQFLFASEP